MKRLLSHLFIVIVNYHLPSALLAVVMLAATMLLGPLNGWLVAALVLLPLALSLGYQLTRGQWPRLSPGEAWLGAASKTDVLRQTHPFVITRWPLLLLLVSTLVINGNLSDGLSEGRSYRLLEVLVAAAVLAVQFYALGSFLRRPSLTPILLLAFSLFSLGLSFQLGSRTLLSADLNRLTGYRVPLLYQALAAAWVLTGWLYQRRSRQPAADAAQSPR